MAGARALPGARPARGRPGWRLGARLGDWRRPLRPPVARQLALHDRLPAPHCAKRGGAPCRCSKRLTANERRALQPSKGMLQARPVQHRARCMTSQGLSLGRLASGRLRSGCVGRGGPRDRRRTRSFSLRSFRCTLSQTRSMLAYSDSSWSSARTWAGHPLRVNKAARAVPVWPAHSVHMHATPACVWVPAACVRSPYDVPR